MIGNALILTDPTEFYKMNPINKLDKYFNMIFVNLYYNHIEYFLLNLAKADINYNFCEY